MDTKPARIQRLLTLITMLQTGKSYVAGGLARELKVGRRTLFRDFAILKLAGIPVRYDPASRTHRIDRSFFLPPVNLTFAEVLALGMLVQKYGARSGLPNVHAALAAMMKIESTLPAEIQAYCGSALDLIEVRPSPMTDAQHTTEVFDRLWRAAREKETLTLRYESYYEQSEIRTRLNPYHLTFISRGWYVIGYSHLHQEVRTFKVDRIVQATPAGAHFRADPRFTLARYFGHAWRMIRGDKRYHVRIRFAAKMAGNVEEVIWHPTQQTQRLDDGSLIYEVDVDGVDEIAWWVLGYGEYAVVEEPPELRKIIQQHLDAMAACYRDS